MLQNLSDTATTMDLTFGYPSKNLLSHYIDTLNYITHSATRRTDYLPDIIRIMRLKMAYYIISIIKCHFECVTLS